MLAILAAGFFAAQSANAWAVSYSVIYSFAPPPDGSTPLAPLLAGKHGVLYGTANGGGTALNGTVFSLNPPASPGGPWIETTLHSFLNDYDVVNPIGQLLAGANGTLYGVGGGVPGGEKNAGVFALTPPSSPGQTWNESILHYFHGYPDGSYPTSIILGNDGFLYGTTYTGGSGDSGYCDTTSAGVSCGVVFALKSSGGFEQVLYDFQGPPDGNQPGSNLLAHNHALLGTTVEGGAVNCGTAFQLEPPAGPGSSWSEDIIYSFADSPDGCIPSSSLVADRNGVLYGTTAMGGTFWGIVFSLTPPTVTGQPWTEAILYKFGAYNKDGESPGGNLVIGPNGVLYGTTLFGGAVGNGTVFSLTPPINPGAAWTEKILHNFGEPPDGDAPSGLTLQKGVLYGTTQLGGTSSAGCNGGCGTVFAVVP